MSQLFSPLALRSITLKNRIAVSPMCQYSSVDGFASDWHLVHLGSRAVGGAGLVIQEATAVSAEGRITYGDLGIYKDEHIAKLRNITSFIRDQGAVPGIQLAHAGRKASCEIPWKGGHQIKEGPNHWTTVAPSAIPFKESDLAPEAMDASDIEKFINDFIQATARALKAGYQLIEIHAAHGYLINQFLSPLSNQRTDQYGGSFENRIRLLLEIVDAVQHVWPAEYPIFVRISATDWADGGWTLDDSIKLAAILREKNIDLIDCSTGGLVPGVHIPVAPGYQVPFAEAVRNQAKIKTGAVGLITNPEQANQILEEGRADLIIMAREMLRDPYFALHAAHSLDDEINWPSQYLRARP